MKNKFLFVVCIFLSLFFLFGMFIYSVKLTDDENHLRNFKKIIKYILFYILHLCFAGEFLPNNSSEIFERIDKQMLKKVYYNQIRYYICATNIFQL